MSVRQPPTGPTWSELAALPQLAAVLDPADLIGAKNGLIDRTHKLALADSLGRVDGLVILDFGCGSGRLTAWLGERGAVVDGTDATKEMLAAARVAAPSARELWLTDGVAVPAESGSYDVVVTSYVLQYYVRNPDLFTAILSELVRVLRSGGRIAAIEQVADDEIGRGGTSDEYMAGLTAAGFAECMSTPLRLGQSRLIELIGGHRALARIPGLPRLIRREAAAAAKAPLTEGRYADFIFLATKP